jgi:prepilin-type N-terminal cleavage/methylation domain-containing protein
MCRQIKPGLPGFTLIEIAVVLILIGVLAASIVVGGDLIKSATIRKQISQIHSMDIAVNTFKGKYNCLAGDCMNAFGYGFGNSSADNGDGNGLIQDGGSFILDNQEAVNFWHHLSAAGLIDGAYNIYTSSIPGTNIPGIASPPLAMTGAGYSYVVGGGTAQSNPKGGLWVVSYNRYLLLVLKRATHAWALTATTAINTWLPIYTPLEVYNIDSKIDDGFPTLGNVQAINGIYQTGFQLQFTTSVYPAACVDDTVNPPVYNVKPADYNDRIHMLCSPLIATEF